MKKAIMGGAPAGPRYLAAALALVLAGALSGCFGISNNVAGGSSEVDNPQILVAFTDTAGSAVRATGSLSIYLADQNPIQTPDPLLTVQVINAASINLTELDFTRGQVLDSTQTYNLLLLGGDSTGGIVLSLSYDPALKKFRRNDSSLTQVRLPLSPLVRYASVLQGGDTSGLNRVIIPGTPYQATVVDSGFVFTQIPSGTYVLHVINEDGVERSLPDSLNTRHEGPHSVDTSAPPIRRPPPPADSFSIGVDAGGDQTVFTGTDTFLGARVLGISPDDPRLAVLWRQIGPGPQNARAVIDDPTALRTHVSFPRPGAYEFVITAATGTQKAEDTVTFGVQGTPVPASFIEPVLNDTLLLERPFDLVWQVPDARKLSLQISLDSGSTWQTIPDQLPPPKSGYTDWLWVPHGGGSANCFLRLRDSSSAPVAVSPRFTLRPARAGDPPPPQN